MITDRRLGQRQPVAGIVCPFRCKWCAGWPCTMPTAATTMSSTITTATATTMGFKRNSAALCAARRSSAGTRPRPRRSPTRLRRGVEKESRKGMVLEKEVLGEDGALLRQLRRLLSRQVNELTHVIFDEGKDKQVSHSYVSPHRHLHLRTAGASGTVAPDCLSRISTAM